MNSDEFNNQFEYQSAPTPPEAQEISYAGHEFDPNDTVSRGRSESTRSSRSSPQQATPTSSSSSSSKPSLFNYTLLTTVLAGSVALGGTILSGILPTSSAIAEEIELNILSVGETAIEYEIFAAEEGLSVRCYNDFVSYEQPLEIGWNRGFFEDLKPNTTFTVSVDGEPRFGSTVIKKETVRTKPAKQTRFGDVKFDYETVEYGVLYTVDYDPEQYADGMFYLTATDRESGEMVAGGEVYAPGEPSELYLYEYCLHNESGRTDFIFALTLVYSSYSQDEEGDKEKTETVTEKLIRLRVPPFADVYFDGYATDTGVAFSAYYDFERYADRVFFVRATDRGNGETIAESVIQRPGEQSELYLMDYCTEEREYEIVLSLICSSDSGEETVTEREIRFFAQPSQPYNDVYFDPYVTDTGISFSVQYDPDSHADDFFVLRVTDADNGEEVATCDVYDSGEQYEVNLMPYCSEKYHTYTFLLSLVSETGKDEEIVVTEQTVQFEINNQ